MNINGFVTMNGVSGWNIAVIDSAGFHNLDPESQLFEIIRQACEILLTNKPSSICGSNRKFTPFSGPNSLPTLSIPLIGFTLLVRKNPPEKRSPFGFTLVMDFKSKEQDEAY